MILMNYYVFVSFLITASKPLRRGTCCDGTKSRRQEVCTNCDKCRNENSFEPGVSAVVWILQLRQNIRQSAG